MTYQPCLGFRPHVVTSIASAALHFANKVLQDIGWGSSSLSQKGQKSSPAVAKSLKVHMQSCLHSTVLDNGESPRGTLRSRQPDEVGFHCQLEDCGGSLLPALNIGCGDQIPQREDFGLYLERRNRLVMSFFHNLLKRV